MTTEKSFALDPWAIRETQFQIENLPQSETLFALSNGHIGMRGTLDEGEPHGLPGSYLNSVYEQRPLPHAEAGYGDAESGQTVINVTDAKLIRLLVEDEPFDIRYGECHEHERELDFRDGVLRRRVRWTSPAGQTVIVRSTRLVSLTQRSVAGIEYEVEAVDAEVRVVLQSELVANEQLPPQSNDPRTAAVLAQPLHSEDHHHSGTMVSMVHQTKQSKIRVAAAMDHFVDGPVSTHVYSDSSPDTGRVTVTAVLKPGEKVKITKFIGYGWSSARSLPALRDQVAAAIAMAKSVGWPALLEEQRDYLDDYWAKADVEIDGDIEIQQAVRFALFHMIQATARAERRGIPAKGLSGPGYDGHTFWDMETFVLHALTYIQPAVVADALRWRHSILPFAKRRAHELSIEGAVFPWRTIHGEECSGYWPASTAAFHLNADIADAVVRYVEVTEDVAFERTIGLELLVETARMWRSLGQHDLAGKFRIDGITGPDEYSSITDNNVYTNLMAQRNLRSAAEAAERHPTQSRSLGVDTEEMASWREAADAIFIPFDEARGVHPQAENFTNHEVWDFENTPAEKYPLLLNFPYFDLYRKQVVKQSDLVLAMHMRPDAFTDEQKLKNFEYYEAITVRDSSLSSCTQAVIAAEVGYLDLAYDYLAEAALVDLHDLGANTRDGLHLASLAGAWMALTMGFGGMRTIGRSVSFKPQLPSGIGRIAFNVSFFGSRIKVDISKGRATYTLCEGEPIEVNHYDQTIKVGFEAQSYDIPRLPHRDRPASPKGRAPVRRHVSG